MFKFEPVTIHEKIVSAGMPILVTNCEGVRAKFIPKHFVEVHDKNKMYQLFYEDNIPRIVYYDRKEKTFKLFISVEEPKKLGKIKLVKYTKDGEPIIIYDGKYLEGYAEISEEILGTNTDGIKSIMSKYLIDDFKPHKLFFSHYALVNQKTYPVFLYNEEEIHGVKGLMKRFPKTDAKLFENKYPKVQKRHEELIEKYQISKVGKQYSLITIDEFNRTKYFKFSSQKKVIEFLKDQGESIGTQTRVDLFKRVSI